MQKRKIMIYFLIASMMIMPLSSTGTNVTTRQNSSSLVTTKNSTSLLPQKNKGNGNIYTGNN